MELRSEKGCAGDARQKLKTTDPTSHQREHPTSTNLQLSKNNQREKGKNWSWVPEGCLGRNITLTLKGSSVLFHKKTDTNESNNCIGHFLVFCERGTEITGTFFNFRTLAEPKPLQDFIDFPAIRNRFASLAESCKNSYCMTVMRNLNCFRVVAFIFNTSAKYEVKISSFCDATIVFTSSVETKCGKEI
jgi:hypothetical protein